MRKIISAVIAFAFVTGSFTSCSKVNNTVNDTAVSDETAANISDTTEKNDEKKHTYSGLYKYEIIDSAENLGYIYNPCKLNDSVYTIGYSYEKGSGVYLTDSNFTDFALQEFRFPDEVLEYDAYYGLPIYNADGSFNVIVSAEDHHGIVIPEEYDESFDYDSYWDECEYIYYSCEYNANGELVFYEKLNLPDEYKSSLDDSFYFSQTISDGHYVYAVSYYEEYPSIVRIDCSTGEIKMLYKCDSYIDLQLFRDRDDKIIIGIPVFEDGNQYSDYNYNYYELNDSGEYTEPFYVMKPSDSMY
ncbi:MAG: hypothetical protein MJ081_08780, partial [Ruminococcus sp.]|nr:hypothetical protein [Ruminococcus sp.]